jgi:hypothetical protein
MDSSEAASARAAAEGPETMPNTPLTREGVVAELTARVTAAGKPRFKEREFRHAKEPAARPAPKATNGGPRIYDCPNEEMRDIGRTLFAGEEAWIPRLARDIGEHPRQVRRWANGESVITKIALHRCRQAIREHIRRLNALLVRLGEDEA